LLPRILVAALIASIIACPGCNPRPASDKAEDPLVIALQSDPTSLDPRLATDAISSRVIDLLFNGLFRNDPKGHLKPDLVENHELEGETAHVFTLRKDVRFSNGAELTAEDVKFTIESILDPTLGSRKRASFKNVAMIETMDRYSLTIWLKKPQASFLESLKIGIIPREYVKEVGEGFGSRPVGTGPFKLIGWEKGSRIELRRHEGYFRGPAPIHAIRCKVVPDTSTRLLELRKGSVDFVQNDIPPELVRSFEQDPQFSVHTAPSSTYKYIGINLKHPILSRRQVRQAMAHAIDRKAIIDHLLLGQATPASGLLCPTNPFYVPDLPGYEYDPGLTNAILDKAGLHIDPQTGYRFAITFKTSKDQRANQIAQIIQQQLASVGIKLEIKSFEWATFYSDIISGNFDVYSLTWVGISDPDFFYDAFHTKSAPPHGVNRGHYSNTKIDELTELGRRELDAAKRRKIYSQVQKIIAQELPYIPLWYPSNVGIMTNRLKGFQLYPAGDFKSFATARVDTAR